MRTFWSSQVRTSWANLEVLPLAERLRSLARLSRRMLAQHWSACLSPSTGQNVADNEKLTVVLMNHRRPENVAIIARYILRSGFVGKLVISNNSQDYPIGKYVKARDSRLVLIDQARPSGVGIRFELARAHPSRYFVCIDDDIFLHPVQLQWIYSSLLRAGERPHGIFGALRSPAEAADKQWPFVHRRNRTTEVDILNGLFAFTKAQLEEYFRLCRVLGIEDPKSLMNGEDIILSFSGEKRPLIHNVGAIWECASASTPGVALHMSRPQFYEERWKLFTELARLKRLVPEPAVAA